MNFTDPLLQKCYETHLTHANGFCGELPHVRALIAAHDLFQTLEGPHSPRVHETIEHLLLPALRPVLRSWYQRPGADTDSATIEFRNHLSELAGERF